MDEVGLGERAWRLLYIYILENAYKNPDFYDFYTGELT